MSHLTTVVDVFEENRRSRPHSTAIVEGDTSWTFRELDDRRLALAAALENCGIAEGDRIVWIGANSHALIELMAAAATLGAMVCPVNWRQSYDELTFVLGDLEPAIVVWQPRHTPDQASLARVGQSRWIRFGDDDDSEYESLFAHGTGSSSDRHEVSDDAALLMLYTAAFEGKPSAAMLSHRALVGHSLVLGIQRRIEEGFIFLTTGPLFHVGTQMFVWSTLVLGGKIVVLPQFDALEACRLIEKERCNAAVLFPPMIDAIVAANTPSNSAGPNFDISSLRFGKGDDAWNSMITIDDSPWGRSNAGYGQTEVAGMLTYHGLGADGIGTHGRPSPLIQLRIVDRHWNDVPDGDTGEMIARGPHIFGGYFARPELNARKFRGGWMRTGDLGRREVDGTVSFVGPASRMIKSAGENIYPAEVEHALAAHPRVVSVAVIGRPDATWGQSVTAVVVSDGDLEERELISFFRDRVASYKKPRTFIFTQSIPMRGWSPDYDALDRLYGGGGYPGG